MKKTITFTLTLDTETARVVALDMTEGEYNRTEFIAEGIDDPASVYDTIQCIDRELTDLL